MNRFIFLLAALTILSGCAAEPVYETMGNVWAETQTEALPASIELGVPEDTQMEVMEQSESGACYQIGDWMLWTEVHQGGDILSTMRSLTGLEEPEIISYTSGAYPCHETVWAVGDDEGECIVRTAVLCHGPYHYCLSMKAPQEQARQMGQLFSQLLDNVYLNDTAP